MRLSNVAHLRLPFGRLHGYDVTARRTGRRLPVSFDQRRHVGGGDRPGSWMAICFTLPEPVARQRLSAAWLAVVARHGTLRSAFAPGPDGQPLLEELDVTPGAWVEHPIAPGQAVNDAVREVLDRACTPFATPSHRLLVLETSLRPTVIIGADHSHVDMWSMLVVIRDLLRALELTDGEQVPDLTVVPAFADHTRALRDRERAPADVHRRWAEVVAASGDVMPRFPLPLGEPITQPERVEVRDVLGVDGAEALAERARADGVSTLAAVVGAMTRITHDLAGRPLRAVFPVHSRYDATWHDSVGWFIANSVLESADPDPHACAAAVKEAVRLGSWPLAEVMAPWGGMPEAPGMFAVSWLDLRRLPVRVDAAGLDAQYVGATGRSDGVMLWFILDEAGLHLRCRYPDTDEARRHVGGWLDALVLDLMARAGMPHGSSAVAPTMRAITYDQYGTTDELRLTDQPVPRVGPSEVRIRVTRAGVNPVDWKLMSGGLDPMLAADFPVVPGWDVAGVVDAVGPDTPEFAVGDRVAAYARKQVLSAGTFAEYVTVRVDDVALVPDGVTDDVAAALPLAGLTALRVLETLAVTKGDTLLVHAASGGVGFALVQLAVAAGADVIGTASAANHDKLSALGVTPVEYGEGLEERLREIAPDGVDAVADLVGGVLDVSLAVLRAEGRLASIADPVVEEHGGRWVWVRPDGGRLADLLDEVVAGRLAVDVDQTFPLEQVPEAFALSQSGRARGKIVISVAD